jgi:hypothetical protein
LHDPESSRSPLDGLLGRRERCLQGHSDKTVGVNFRDGNGV